MGYRSDSKRDCKMGLYQAGKQPLVGFPRAPFLGLVLLNDVVAALKHILSKFVDNTELTRAFGRQILTQAGQSLPV